MGNSIRQRANGTYATDVTVAPGKRKTVYGKTPAEAQQKAQVLRAKITLGITDATEKPKEDRTSLLSGHLTKWLEGVKTSKKLNTFTLYSDTVKNHVTPRIGAVPLAELTPMVMHDYFNALAAPRPEGAGLSVQMRRLIRTILAGAFEKAQAWDLLHRNPLVGIELPQPNPKRGTAWAVSDITKFRTAARDSRLAALFEMALHTQAREGELLGLQWRKIDLSSGKLRLDETLIEIKGKIIGLFPSKTEKSRRTLDLAPETVRVLKAHHARLVESGVDPSQPGAWVFPARGGGPMTKREAVGEFKRLVKVAGVQEIRFHDLRHTGVSLLLAAGEAPGVVQERVGHASIKTTMDVYGHVMPGKQAAASARVLQMMGVG